MPASVRLTVIVWIGEAADNSELAIAGMTYLDKEENRESLFRSAHDDACMDYMNDLYKSLLAFYRRPWFRRTWIRQEITVARRVIVYCGRDSVPWYTMKGCARRLQALEKKIKNESH